VLVTEKTAQRDVLRYGGKVVEIVTIAAFLKEISKKLPPCKLRACGALTGEPCKDGGYLVRPHANRTGGLDGRFDTEADGLPACPESACPAEEHRPCVSPSGKRRKPHKSRLALVAKPEGAE